MRHTYELTKETLKTLTGHVGEIAEEMQVTDKFLYGVLAGVNTDPFAPFEHLYASTARAGVSRCHWRARLDAIDARYDKQRPKAGIVECLAEKITTDAETSERMVEAIRDGRVTAAEAEKIRAAVEKERRTLDLIDTVLQFVAIDNERGKSNGTSRLM